jgi:t-SNARE complex subunit (syntaxin)
MPNCLFLLQRLKGNMSGDVRYFNNIETRTVMEFFFCFFIVFVVVVVVVVVVRPPPPP